MFNLPAQKAVNVSVVSMENIDRNIGESIAKFGKSITLQRAAIAAATGGDNFFRTVLILATIDGVFRLDATEKGGFDAKHPIVQSYLTAISADHTNSQRKQCSKALSTGWKAARNGVDPLNCPSVSALEKAAKSVKDINVMLDVDSCSDSAAAAAAAATATATAAAAEAAQAAEQAAAQAASEAASEALSAILLSDIRTALYGTKAEKAAIAAKYPKTA